MKKIFLTVLTIFCIINIYSLTTEYNFVNEFSDEWELAGVEGDIPYHDPDIICEIDTSMTAYDINLKIENVMSSNDLGPDHIALIRMAPGEYELDETIQLYSYMILKGNHQFRRDEDRAERTILNFNLPDKTSPSGGGTSVIDYNCIQIGSPGDQGTGTRY